MIDPKRLALPGKSLPPKTEIKSPEPHGKAPKHKPGQRFLRGPIPWSWVCTASVASGQGSGLKVAMAIWHLVGLNRGKAAIRLSGARLRELGVDRHAGYRGLSSLEEAGLVRVDRQPGRNPLVTVLEPPQDDG